MHESRIQWHILSCLSLLAYVNDIDLEALGAVVCTSNHGLLRVSLGSDNPSPMLQAVHPITYPAVHLPSALANRSHRYGIVNKLIFAGLWNSIFPGQARQA